MRHLFAIFTTIALAGCVVASAPSPYPPPRVEISPPPNPYPPPPSLRVEIVPPPPRETVVWEPGRWHWDGRGYVWIGGHYVERVVGRHWEAGHWMWNGNSWGWVGGHWS
jgi:hypothetical protein